MVTLCVMIVSLLASCDCCWTENGSCAQVSDNGGLKDFSGMVNNCSVASELNHREPAMLVYNRNELLKYRNLCGGHDVRRCDCNIKQIVPQEVLFTNRLCWRKRGRKGGLRVRLKRRKFRPPLPSVVLGNARSLNNKTDELQANAKFLSEYKDSCVMCFTETWLHDQIPDSHVLLDRFQLVRADRTDDSGKSKGGGLCMYINDQWCTNFTTKSTFCNELVELLVVSCRPFYLPREVSSIRLILVYVPEKPSSEADRCAVAERIADAVSNCLNENPDSAILILGDFNGCDISGDLPNFKQYVNCSTRNDKILDLCFCNIADAYRARKLPPLGKSDHNVVLLMPTYKQALKRNPKTVKQVKVWNDATSDKLSGCFACTDWSVFQEACSDLSELVDTVSSYILFCEEICVETKEVKFYPNNKPWVTKELKGMIREKRTVFKTGNMVNYRELQGELEAEIKRCKSVYKNKIEDMFTSNNYRMAWQGLQKLTGYKQGKKSVDVQDSLAFAEELNTFYARFDQDDYSEEQEAIREQFRHVNETCDFKESDIRSTFKALNRSKAAGPDGVSPAVLKQCAEELAPVYKTLFDKSVCEHSIPVVWKTSTIVPVPKKKEPQELNDYRPVALTSVAMKCLERLILQDIMQTTANQLDSNQFAYRPNRGVEDSLITMLHKIYEHLDNVDAYVRVLFIDFSSAFNTIQPHVMVNRLVELNVPENLCLWTLEFLTNRKQCVRVNNVTSSMCTTNTGAPQGCVLSPVLFILYTNSFTASQQECNVFKYADDTAILGRVVNYEESGYRQEILNAVEWCREHHLVLNASKTKELIIDLRSRPMCHYPVFIDDTAVDIVSKYKYLGTFIDNKLKWNENVHSLWKKGWQRMYFLRKLNSFHIDCTLLKLFYKSVVLSVFTFSCICWWNNLSVANKNKLERIRKAAQRVVGLDLDNLNSVYCGKVLKKVNGMLEMEHPLSDELCWLRSGRRLLACKCKTNRYRDSFLPTAIRLYNEHNMSVSSTCSTSVI